MLCVFFVFIGGEIVEKIFTSSHRQNVVFTERYSYLLFCIPRQVLLASRICEWNLCEEIESIFQAHLSILKVISLAAPTDLRLSVFANDCNNESICRWTHMQWYKRLELNRWFGIRNCDCWHRHFKCIPTILKLQAIQLFLHMPTRPMDSSQRVFRSIITFDRLLHSICWTTIQFINTISSV